MTNEELLKQYNAEKYDAEVVFKGCQDGSEGAAYDVWFQTKKKIVDKWLEENADNDLAKSFTELKSNVTSYKGARDNTYEILLQDYWNTFEAVVDKWVEENGN